MRTILEKVLEEVQGKESRKTIDKRKLLALATLAAAGVAISPLIEKAHANQGDYLVLGEENSGDDSLGIGHTTALGSKVNSVIMPAPYPAVLRINNSGDNVEGQHPPVAIAGFCDQGLGIAGYSTKAIAVHGHSINDIGVQGYSDNDRGVLGEGPKIGVEGRTDSGVGVSGYSDNGIGVQARCGANGTALNVEGKSAFNGKEGDPWIIGQDNSAELEEITQYHGTVNSSNEHYPATIIINNNGENIVGQHPPVAISARCQQGIGVAGYSTMGMAVHGNSQGNSPDSVGVDGHSDYGIGVRAKSPNGTALQVDGKGHVRATVNSVSINEIVAALSVQNDGSTSEGHHPTIAIEGSIGNGWGVSGHSNWWGVVGHGNQAGVFGRSDEGRGIYGESHGNGTAVYGHSDTGFGVHGTTNGDQNSVGLRGESTNGWGITADGGKGGVMGWGGECGVRGTSHDGMGVIGLSNNNIAVWAESANGTALWVLGKGTARAKVDSAPQADIESHLIPLPSAFTVENSGERLESPPTHHPPIAILGMCPNGMGLSGLSDIAEGVHGRSTHGVGIAGKTVDGTGVHATAESTVGTALKVDGKGIMQAMVDGGTTFSVDNAGIQPNGGGRPEAIVGTCAEGIGVHGASEKSHGVHGGSVYSEAIDGHSVYGIGVIGHTEEEGGPGVMGWTFNPNGVGVVGGGGETGTGVRGQSTGGIGVHATSENGTALKVEGRGTISATVDNTVTLNVSNNSENNGGAINAYSKSAAAVLGGSDANVGLIGMSSAKSIPGLPGEPGLPGIEGFSHFSFGVLGLSDIMPSTDFINWYTDPNRGLGGLLGYTKEGKGVVGFSDTGIGVQAISKGTGLMVEGKSEMTSTLDNNPALGVYNNSQSNGMGISAYSKSSAAIIGRSEGKSAPGLPGEPGIPAIEGFTQFSFGVAGLGIDVSNTPPSTDFISWYTDPNRGSGGLLGYAKDGKGVVGFADTGVGVLAISKNSPALRVEGKSSFSTVGSGTIPRKALTVNVASGLVTANSHISVTLTSDPAGDAIVSWIQRDPANKRFTINLNKAVGKDTTFTYFIVEP